jgi:hypothetical protein
VNRIVLGALAALLLVGAGIFWWQGRAATERGADLPAAPAATATAQLLPGESGAGLRGAAPPEVDEVTREQRRFDRLDRNRDGRVNRTEMLSPRVPMFRKLDKDGNNLLSFEEWSVRTNERFAGADANRDASLDRAEFARTKPKRAAKPECRCPPPRRASRPARAKAPEPEVESDEDGAEPAD